LTCTCKSIEQKQKKKEKEISRKRAIGMPTQINEFTSKKTKKDFERHHPNGKINSKEVDQTKFYPSISDSMSLLLTIDRS